jgi:hypothetical protein
MAVCTPPEEGSDADLLLELSLCPRIVDSSDNDDDKDDDSSSVDGGGTSVSFRS